MSFHMIQKMLLVGTITLVVAGCATDEQTVRIGVILPLTGDAASVGIDMSNGIKLAAAEVNTKGGIDGNNVEFIFEDGRCNGPDAVSAVEKLMSIDRVVAIIGGLCSDETLAVAPITEAAKIVLMSPGSSSSDVTNAGSYVFRNYPSDALKTAATAAVVKEKGYKAMAMISEDTDFCQGIVNGMRTTVGGDAIVFDEKVELGTKDFRPIIEKLKKTKFDVFYPNTNGDTSMAALVQQFRDAGFTQPILSHEVADSSRLGDAITSDVEGMQLVTVRTSGEGTDFEKNFIQKYQEVQSGITYAAHAYDAARLLIQIIDKKGTDGTAMRDALLVMPGFKGIIGDIRFDKNGDVVGVPFVLKEFKDGRTFTVKSISL